MMRWTISTHRVLSEPRRLSLDTTWRHLGATNVRWRRDADGHHVCELDAPADADLSIDLCAAASGGNIIAWDVRRYHWENVR